MMRDKRGIDVRETTDDDVLLSLFELADEATRLHDRSAELALQLDQLAGLIGERWARGALDRIEETERAEIGVCRR
jgi:hypothetical protein